MFVLILLGIIGNMLDAGALYWVMFVFACLGKLFTVVYDASK